MVKITYDENNIEERQLVEDYFWFEYYLNVIESDILKNDCLSQKMEIILTYYNLPLLLLTHPSINEAEIDQLNKLQDEVNTTIESTLNKFESKRFVDLYNTHISDEINDFKCERYELSMYEIILDIKTTGIKEIKGIYKKILIEKYGDNNNL